MTRTSNKHRGKKANDDEFKTDDLSLNVDQSLISKTFEYFDEVKAKGFTSDKQFPQVRKPLVRYLAASSFPDRKSPLESSIKLPDGMKADTVFHLRPEGGLFIGEARQRLNSTNSSGQFVDTLRAIIEESEGGSQSEALSCLSVVKKGREDQMGQEPRVAKRPRITLKMSAAQDQKGPAPLASDTLAPARETESGLTDAQSQSKIEYPFSAIETGQEKVSMSVDDEDANDIDLEEVDRNQTNEDSAHVIAAAFFHHHPGSQRQENDGTAINDTHAHQTSIGLQDLRQGISRITAADWDALQPSVVEYLSEMEASLVVPEASMDPEMADTGLKRLNAALPRLAPDIPSLPPLNWETYLAQLTRTCGTLTFNEMNFRQRLYHIIDIVYRKEEDQILGQETWDASRLEAAARITIVLAEVLGPENEEIGEEDTRGWLRVKMRDLKFLSKIFLATSRARGDETTEEREKAVSEGSQAMDID